MTITYTSDPESNNGSRADRRRADEHPLRRSRSQSGLLGVSETSSYMRALLDRESLDVPEREAVALFCYQVKKWTGAFAAALGGLDTLVFAGGIGENAPLVRTRICDGMGFLGIYLEEKPNAASFAVVSAAASRVAVRVMHTDEEWMIAKSVCRVLISQ